MRINPEFNKILREALDKLNKKEEQMKFTVIDESGNSTVVEAEDIVEAIELCSNSQTGVRHVVAAALVGEE